MRGLCSVVGLVGLLVVSAGEPAQSAQVHGVTPLMRAAEEGQLLRVKRLLRNKPNINARDRTGSTALMLAIAGRETPSDAEGEVNNRKDRPKERLAIVDLLLKNGASRDLAANEGCATQSTVKGVTPLMRAVEVGRLDMARAIVRANSRSRLDLAAANSNGATALHYAARQPSAEFVRLLLSAGAKVDARAPGGETALMAAAGADNVEAVRTLLNSGADPNLATAQGETALHASASLKIVKLLRSSGARITLNRAGISAYTLALWQGDRERIGFLKGMNPPPAYFDAVLLRDLPALENWLARGASANARFVNGSPILHVAARTSSPAVVRALLKSGARIEAKDAYGERTAIHEALVEGIDEPRSAEEDSRRLEVVTALIDEGASPVERDRRTRYSPVMFAAKRNSLPLVKLLLDRGAVVEKDDLENLRLVAPDMSREIVELLMSRRK